MKKATLLILTILHFSAFAQQAAEIDPKSIKLPRYADLTAITSAIASPQKGMMVYNNATASNWYYNGSAWANTAGVIQLPSTNTLNNAGSLLTITNTSAYDNSPVAIKGVLTTAYPFNVFGSNPPYYFAAVKGEATGTTPISFSSFGRSAIGVYGEAAGTNIGVAGKSVDGNGVYGNSDTYRGVNGFSESGVGGYFRSNSGYALITEDGNVGIGNTTPTAKLDVSGQAKVFNGPNISVDASNSSAANPTVRIVNSTNLGPAVDITGGIKVSGTSKAAFKIVTSPTYILANKFGIVNTTMANAATDILIVTYEYTDGTYLNKQFATFWNGGNWEIHLTDGTAMPSGITFNVLVIKQ
ncbi:MAG TPA: hypothetical protein VK175_04815 [Leadbetterella sp.]|nr:hypothetical protein [Leadbetterella sp.]